MTAAGDPLVRDDDPRWLKNAALPKADADGAAIAALAFAFLLPPLGIILGHVSRGQARRHGQQPSGVATAGCLLGYAFTIVYVAVVIAVIIAAAHGHSYAECVNNAISTGQDPSAVCPP